MQKFLEGIKVLDLSSVLAGPSVGMFLGELGADVIKIENPLTKGDVTRQWKCPAENTENTVSAYYASVNAYKKIIFLNLQDSSSIEKIYNLLADSDIVLVNFKYGDDKKFQLDYESVRKINPEIIYAQITGFGKEESRVAFDLVLQAETGFMHLNREQGQLPNKMPVALMDVLAAHHLKEGILLALYNRQKTGKGAYVHCSLYNAAICSLLNQASHYLNAGYNPPPMGSRHPNIAPYGEIFSTSDDKLITFAIGNDKQFSLLCDVLQANELSQNEMYSSNAQRVKNRETLYHHLQNKIKNFTTDSIYKECLNKQIPVAMIKDIEEVFKNTSAQKLIRRVEIDNQLFNVVTSVAFDIE